MIKLKNLIDESWYHAGPRKLNINDIDFDRGALGFHVGNVDQVNYIASGKTKKGRNLPISSFEILEESLDGKYWMAEIERDMPWEHADLLAVDLVSVSLVNPKDIHNLADEWDINDDDFYENEFHSYIDKASYLGEKYCASDDIGFNLAYEFYENTDKLRQLRLLLLKAGVGAIMYRNDVEGESVGEYSIVVLHPSMIKEVSIPSK